MNCINNKKDWIPTPTYLCRKEMVLKFLGEINKGTFLEIGIGSGDLVLEMAKRNYIGIGTDLSDKSVQMVQEELRNIGSKIRVEKKDLFDIAGNFDIIIILEVIEHIKDDKKALKKIYELLNKDGHLIISAPAHKKKWSIGDEWAGHYRRYEKHEIKSKIEETGFEMIKLYNYGFPAVNIIKPIRDYFKNKSGLSQDKTINTKRSGMDRKYENKFSFMINKFTMAPFLFLQRFFFNKDLGDGYIILAKK